MADASDDSLSLSQLSSQLLAHGYTSRPLDLVSLFLTPPPSHSLKKADPGAYAAHVERIRAERTARDQVVKCLWNMLGARMDAVESIETLRSREMVGAYELERAKGLLGRAEKERDKAKKDAEGERAKAKAAQQDLVLEQDRHRRARDEVTKARTALQLVRTQAVHDIKRRETEALAATARLQRLTSTVHTSSRLVVLNSSLAAPSPVLSSSVSVRRRNPVASTSLPEAPLCGNSAEIALLEDALAVCDEERRRGEAEIRTLRECLGEVGEWCGGVIAGIKGFERESRDAVEDGDRWEADESLLIPHPQFARPADSFAPTIHGALHHIRTRILDAVDATSAEVATARAILEEELEEERKARATEEERRAEVERELESARLLVEQGEQLVSDFANERFLAGVGGAAVAAEPRQMYGDESIDEIVPGPTVSQQEDDDRRAAAAKLVKERSRIESERAEKKRRRAVAAMLGELTFTDDADDSAPAPPPKPKPTHSRIHSSSAPSLPTLDEVPSPFLARVPLVPAPTAAPIPPAKAPMDALAQILAMADDSPVRTAPPRPAAIIAPRKIESALRKVVEPTKEVGKGKPRALHSTQTTERTKVVITASFPAGGKRKAGPSASGEKENERRKM